jgi:hypothetical protein
MAIDFHLKTNRSTYTGRLADAGWADAIGISRVAPDDRFSMNSAIPKSRI